MGLTTRSSQHCSTGTESIPERAQAHEKRNKGAIAPRHSKNQSAVNLGIGIMPHS